MALFKKKAKETETEDEVSTSGKLTKPVRRRASTNGRKKALPAGRQAWGRKERLLVLIVLLGSVFASAALGLAAREWKLPGLPELKLPEISFEQRIILDNPNASPANKESSAADAQEALDDFKKLTRDLSGIYGLYVYRFDSRTSYGFDENDVFGAASLMKLPVFIALYKEFEVGRIDLDSSYVLRDEDKSGGSGSLIGKPAGTKLTYRELAEYMGKESDNTAFTIVVNKLGQEKIEKVITEIGMPSTNFTEFDTSPKDIGTLFTKLWDGELVSAEDRDEILSFMTDTIYENHLAAGVPDDVVVAHKYGRELHIVNDAGIVLAKKPYVVVIMGKGVVETEADQIFPELSRLIYEFETR